MASKQIFCMDALRDAMVWAKTEQWQLSVRLPLTAKEDLRGPRPDLLLDLPKDAPSSKTALRTLKEHLDDLPVRQFERPRFLVPAVGPQTWMHAGGAWEGVERGRGASAGTPPLPEGATKQTWEAVGTATKSAEVSSCRSLLGASKALSPSWPA